jgi:geranylgeranyl transferase type-2 subunit beta
VVTEPFLIRLGTRLTEGLAGFDEARRQRHRDFVLSRQQPDGGFAGREGDSDLYYTSFAVRTLAMLGTVAEPERAALTAYLRMHDWRRLGVIDLMNWLWLAMAVQALGGDDLLAGVPPGWVDEITARLEAVRTADGGYAKSAEGALGSTYHSFLIALTYQLLGRDVPRPGALIQFLYDRQRDDGGFVEIAPMRRSGTNPTAAAVALLNLLGAMDEELREDIRRFVREVRSDEGGLQANTRVPFADGLSTFTGLLTVQDLGLADVLDTGRVRQFVETALEFPTGGFRAASWDEAADVEYTFYGLGTLALLPESAS